MIPKETLDMLPRDRVLQALRHEQAQDRLPLDWFAVARASKNMYQYLYPNGDGPKGSKNFVVADAVHSDMRCLYRPPYTGEQVKYEDGTYLDPLGFHKRFVVSETSEYEEYAGYPLADAESIEDLENFKWPDPDDFNYDAYTGAMHSLHKKYITRIWSGGLFECAWGYTGMETFLENFYMEPELNKYILDKLTDFWLGYLDRCFKAWGDDLDMVFTYDDIGSNIGPMMSFETWEEFIKPCHKKINKFIHNHGKIVFYHCDGDIFQKDFLEGFIDMGVDILDPIQMCGEMTLEELKRDYGDRLCFHGGIDTQHLLPYGTPEEVVAEVRRVSDALGVDGGFILASCHAVQGDVPVANLKAMYEEATGLPIEPRV